MQEQGDIFISQEITNNSPEKMNAKQEEIHDLLFSREIEWQEIIYDLINTEQLDPWDIDLIVLTERYFKRIAELEEQDFFVSSKVLLAASFLLRIKSEILLNKYIKSIDEILFGRKDLPKKSPFERIELEDDIPELIPRSPFPRLKKVTLQELMESLNKAITTENRRIKKEIVNKNALRESSISLPKRNYSIKDKIKEITEKLEVHFNSQEIHKKITFTELAGDDKEKRIDHFSPLLHIENQNKIWLDQPIHFEEIHIWEKKNFWKNKGNPYQDLIDMLKEGTYTGVSTPDEEFDKFSDKEEEPIIDDLENIKKNISYENDEDNE